MHCVDLGESFPTHIYLQKSASIQPRTSPSKFGGKIQFNIHFTPYWRSGLLTSTNLSAYYHFQRLETYIFWTVFQQGFRKCSISISEYYPNAARASEFAAKDMPAGFGVPSQDLSSGLDDWSAAQFHSREQTSVRFNGGAGFVRALSRFSCWRCKGESDRI